MWKIKNIYEADRTSSVLAHCEQCAVITIRESCEGASHECAHGCEEFRPGGKLKTLVELVNDSGETKSIEVTLAPKTLATWTEVVYSNKV